MFELNKTKQALLDMLLKSEKLKVSKVLLVLYDEIKRLQNEGYLLTDILNFINEGYEIDITYSNFQRWIYRRKRKRKVREKTFVKEIKTQSDIDALKNAFKNKPCPKKDELI